jgi:Fur family transcriptional regulator, ferric uptake regulator
MVTATGSPGHEVLRGSDRAAELDRELRAHGYRVTQQRRAVWGALHAATGHATVDEVHALTDGSVDLASVYRALALFQELGLARENHLGDGDAGRWELAHPDEHFHLVCDTCGDVDHHVGSLVAAIREHLDGDHRFEVGSVDLVVTGRCSRCRD